MMSIFWTACKSAKTRKQFLSVWILQTIFQNAQKQSPFINCPQLISVEWMSIRCMRSYSSVSFRFAVIRQIGGIELSWKRLCRVVHEFRWFFVIRFQTVFWFLKGDPKGLSTATLNTLSGVNLAAPIFMSTLNCYYRFALNIQLFLLNRK